jgi:hypothetical protein
MVYCRFITLASLLAMPAVVMAGPVSGSVTAKLNITGVRPDGSAADVMIGQFVKVDPSTGAVVFNQSAGTKISAPLGVFSFETAGADAPEIFDRNTLKYVKPIGSTVLRWDSFMRDDGIFDNTAATVGTNSASSFEWAVSANVDPYMTYGLSIKNSTSGTASYGFSFSESLVPPVSGAYSLYADISGSVVNAGAGTTLALNTTSGSTVQKVFLDDGYGPVPASVDVGGAFALASTGGAGYGAAGSATNSGFLGTGAFTSWGFNVNFSLTGGGDVATLSGYAEITPIPEPQTYALLAAGLLGVGMMLRRNSQR